MVYRIPLHRRGRAIQFLPQAVLLHYIAKIQTNIIWDLNSLTLSVEPEHVFQYCTCNIAARRRHIQFYYKSKSFYSAYVYRIEKYRITAKIFNTYRIVRHAYRYTSKFISYRNTKFVSQYIVIFLSSNQTVYFSFNSCLGAIASPEGVYLSHLGPYKRSPYSCASMYIILILLHKGQN